jgi:hypothetical protein
MRYIILILFSLCLVPNTKAQIYEVGLFLGGSNFIGDVGDTQYIAPQRPAGGLLLKWNRSPRHAFRASFLLTELEGNDSASDDPRRIARDYDFRNTIMEISAGMEFNFLDFDQHSLEPQMTPYLYTGISTARHKNYFFPPGPSGEQTFENTFSWAYGIPMVLGFKATTVEGLVLGAEVGVRYTFSDKIDGSVPDAPSRKPLSFGNLNSNDWYVFSGITLTYTFGEKPCYCSY